MNISKYIELLRFYVTDKIGQTTQSIKSSLSNDTEEMKSSILSAIFSLFISSEFIKINGYGGAFLKVFIVIISYFSLKFVIKKIQRYRKTNKEQKAADESSLTKDEAKSLIDKFDHIACDGILLSRDYFQKYDDIQVGKADNERLFYLFEAFYYYKKALQIAALVVKYPKSCFNNANNINGISMYRFINVYNSLDEIMGQLNGEIKSVEKIEYHSELSKEMLDTREKLSTIKKYIDSIKSN